MITLELFKKTLTNLQEFEKDIEAVDKALKKLSPDFGGFNMYEPQRSILSLLEEWTNDNCCWIEYFIYGLDWGKKWKVGTIMGNGEDIKLQTIEDLYKLLTENK